VQWTDDGGKLGTGIQQALFTFARRVGVGSSEGGNSALFEGAKRKMGQVSLLGL